ncbi:MAG: YggT family protein [Rhodospirillales bacterium]|jgi:YggT family protein|nr:YggT family protein [Rhodospirillales bacterium]MDP6805652.1 YggT family protein [Rhodospirillales bacterium]
MDVILIELLAFLSNVIGLYVWVIIAGVVLSWLSAFNVINRSNRFVHLLGDFIFRITEPALRPIRNLLPNLGGIDISPVILILILWMVRGMVHGFIGKIA